MTVMRELEIGRPRTPRLRVEVVDANGATAVGAVLAIAIDDRPMGAIVIGSDSGRFVTLEFEGSLEGRERVELTAMLGGVERSIAVRAGAAEAFIELSGAEATTAFVARIAHCPDGTSGSPCVVCRSGGKVWRMCA